jgi:hypothetical protein
VTVSPQNAREFLGAVVLAILFVADDELTWREDDAGHITVENGDKRLLEIDTETRAVRFFSIFDKHFAPVNPKRAEKIVTMVEFFLRRKLKPGDEIGLDYPYKAKKYRLDARVVSRGVFKLKAWPDEAFPCARVDGKITGWGGDKQTTVDAYIGLEGRLAAQILRASFKYTDWPEVTMTLAGAEGGQ